MSGKRIWCRSVPKNSKFYNCRAWSKLTITKNGFLASCEENYKTNRRGSQFTNRIDTQRGATLALKNQCYTTFILDQISKISSQTKNPLTAWGQKWHVIIFKSFLVNGTCIGAFSTTVTNLIIGME